MLSATLILSAASAGCATHADVCVRPQYHDYQKVAIWARLDRTAEELFIPLYMDAFPRQALVERRDLETVLDEQDILPERLDEQTRAKIRQVFGVEAIVFPNYTPAMRQLAVKAIDTETGEIVAALVLTGSQGQNKRTHAEICADLIRNAITQLQRGSAAENTRRNASIRR